MKKQLKFVSRLRQRLSDLKKWSEFSVSRISDNIDSDDADIITDSDLVEQDILRLKLPPFRPPNKDWQKSFYSDLILFCIRAVVVIVIVFILYSCFFFLFTSS